MSDAPTASPWRYRLLDRALRQGLAPDALLRAGALYGVFARERREAAGGPAAIEDRRRALVSRMSTGPVAEATEAANEQHYELPVEFMSLILGPRLKYSGCLWEGRASSLADAEESMLALTCERAKLEKGQRILDLGCGWGSLSLWAAERFPGSEVVGVSNSHAQRRHIEARARERGLSNATVVTADVNRFAPSGQFDRVLSIEMFEHMRNWRELLRRVGSWLAPDGKAFVQVFSHRSLPYLFESTWAAERFFTGGLMPSHELLLHFQRDLQVDDRWAVAGTHYAKTLQAWLGNLDARSEEALHILESSGRSRSEARQLLGAWRLFLLSTATMWNFRQGRHWLVSHYLMSA